MLSVHGKNRMHLIFLENLLLKCFLQQSQDIQPYSDNQIKRPRSAVFRTPSTWKVHWPMLAAKTTGGSTNLNSGRANFFRRISLSIYCCWTTRVYQAKIEGWERNCKSNQFFNCRSEKQSGPLGIWWGTGVWLQTILACTVINAKRVTLSLIKRLFGEYDISRVKAVARGNK